MNDEHIRENPAKTDPPETHLHTPTDDARRINGTWSRWGDLIPSSGSRRHLTFLRRTKTLTKLEKRI